MHEVRRPFAERLLDWSLRRLGYGNGDSASNGEYRLLSEWEFPAEPVIFDVGSNTGDWAAAALARVPGCHVYCFEPSRPLVARLRRRLGDSVSVFDLALSDVIGEAPLYADQLGSGLGSLVERDLSHVDLQVSPIERVQTTTLDCFCADHGIEAIDFLKIDTEGAELGVLRGGAGMLDRIGSVQFEYGGTAVDARHYLRDFYRLLEPRGFLLYRIVSDGVLPVGRYRERNELPCYCNYLAVRAGD
jgi:FkbM family methyltransferase